MPPDNPSYDYYNYNANNTGRRGAFTLLELSIVIVIIGLLISMGFSISKKMIDTAKLSATQNRMDAIEKSLSTFFQKNGRLPCPGDESLQISSANYGLEASAAGLDTCAGGAIAASYTTNATYVRKAAEGSVPVLTLGLPKDFMYDGWGRKIAYAVNPVMTTSGYARDYFPLKHSVCATNTAIRIKDASGAYRSSSAVYALISYGLNGHGGYGNDGARYNKGATGADELTNCHCTSAAVDSAYNGDYVQRSPNPYIWGTDYFDDIVRYKERWQLVTDGGANDNGYRGPDLAVAFQKAATGTVYVYNNQCAAFVKQAALNPLPTQKPLGIAFTAGNRHLLTYSALGCNLYKISGGGILTNQSSAFSTACTYNASGTMALSNNGYLAIADTTNIKFWKQSGDVFVKLNTAYDFANTNTLTSFSPDAVYFAVLPTASGTTVPVYRRNSNDSFTSITAASHSTATAKNSVAFSKDGKYLAATSSANIYLWRVLNNGAFLAITTLTPAGSSALTGVTFSPDGRYMVVGRAETPYLIIYKIDPNDTFTALAAPTGVPAASTGLGFSFSSDSNYLAMVTANTSHPVLLFNRTAANSYKYMAAPFTAGATPTTPLDNILASSSGGAVAFSR